MAAFGQAKYQVRFDWGAADGRRILTGAHVAVLVDALSFTTSVVMAAEQGIETEVSDAAAGATGALALELGTDGAIVLAASMRNRSAVAEQILAMQEQRGERVIVAVIAAGEGAEDDGTRFAIEDQLVAGAVIDALIGVGIDHTSPEAAVACASFEGLRHAATHLMTASGSAVALAASGRRDEVRPATERDVTRVVPELRDGAFRA